MYRRVLYMPSLQELGAFFGTVGATVAATYTTVNAPKPTAISPVQNQPQQSGTLAAWGGDSKNIIMLLLVGVAVIFGLRAIRK